MCYSLYRNKHPVAEFLKQKKTNNKRENTKQPETVKNYMKKAIQIEIWWLLAIVALLETKICLYDLYNAIHKMMMNACLLECS